MWIFIVLLFCADFQVNAERPAKDRIIEISVFKNDYDDYNCSLNFIPKINKKDLVIMKVGSPVKLQDLKCGSYQLDGKKKSFMNRILKLGNLDKNVTDNYIYHNNVDLNGILENTTYCFFAVNKNCSCQDDDYGCDYIDGFKDHCGAECEINLNYTDPDMSIIKVNGHQINISLHEDKEYDAIGTFKYYPGMNVTINCTTTTFSKTYVFNFKSNIDLSPYQREKANKYSMLFKDLNMTLLADHNDKYIDCKGLSIKGDSTYNIRLLLEMDKSEESPKNPDFEYWILAACIAPLLIIIIGIIICLCRRKKTNNKPNMTTPILVENEYSSRPGDTLTTNSTMEYAYANPSDYAENAYSLPYSPRTVQELYSTPIPKNQRHDDQATAKPSEKVVRKKFGVSSSDILNSRDKLAGKHESFEVSSPYAEVSNKSESPYSEVSNKSESPYVEVSNKSESPYSEVSDKSVSPYAVSNKSESPYAEVSNKSESPHTEVSSKSDTACAKIELSSQKKLINKKEKPYAKFSYIINEPHSYTNVFDKSQHINTNTAKSDYVGPAYYDLAGK